MRMMRQYYATKTNEETSYRKRQPKATRKHFFCHTDAFTNSFFAQLKLSEPLLTSFSDHLAALIYPKSLRLLIKSIKNKTN
jgi:hypothetical protein